jgi:hypothetical protein
VVSRNPILLAALSHIALSGIGTVPFSKSHDFFSDDENGIIPFSTNEK